MATETTNFYTITAFDAETWWNFLMREYPENYECARYYYNRHYYHNNEDKDKIKINDYFEAHDLPRITAVNGIIKVNNQPVKRYDGFDEWKRKRIEFEKLKRTELFMKWKSDQFMCQKNQCAWCQKDLFEDNTEIQVDHVQPLIYEGTNALKNLVLTCADCNYHKGTKTEGYNTGMRDRVNNAIPSWIDRNYFAYYDIPHIEVTAADIKEFEERQKAKKDALKRHYKNDHYPKKTYKVKYSYGFDKVPA